MYMPWVLVLLLFCSCDLFESGPSKHDVNVALSEAAEAKKAAEEANEAAEEAEQKAEELEQKLDDLESRIDNCRCAR